MRFTICRPNYPASVSSMTFILLNHPQALTCMNITLTNVHKMLLLIINKNIFNKKKHKSTLKIAIYIQ